MRPLRVSRLLASVLICLAASTAATASAADPVGQLPNGRQLDPEGRLTPLGPFPTGGALTPDSRFYWAVDAGRGSKRGCGSSIIETGEILQTLPIPGGYVGVAFAPDGKRAYVSGEPAEGPSRLTPRASRWRR